jgi:Ca2+:H+ antiporter
LIVSVIALVKDEILIVQTSLIGSMLSNLLLVLGMCFFFGGLNRMEQNFNVVVAQTASSLLALAIGSLVLPTAFHSFAGDNQTAKDPTAKNDSTAGSEGIAPLSRGTSIILLFVYACYLFFQLKSHVDMYTKQSEKVEKRDIGRGARKMKQKLHRRSSSDERDHQATLADEQAKVNAEREEVPQLHLWVAIGTLAASTVLVAFCAEFMVSSIDAITVCGSGVSKTFVGLILLPIVGNAAEHATAVTVACKDKMDLSIGVAVGSSMQIALLVLPFIVILGWITGHNDMTLWFDGYQIVVLFITILLVNYLIQDGKSHWLEGVLLMTLYLIIAVSAWYVTTQYLFSSPLPLTQTFRYYPTKGDGACPKGQ